MRALGVAAMVTPPGGVAAIDEPAPTASPPPAPTGPGPKLRLALFGLALIVVALVAVFAVLKLLSAP